MFRASTDIPIMTTMPKTRHAMRLRRTHGVTAGAQRLAGIRMLMLRAFTVRLVFTRPTLIFRT